MDVSRNQKGYKVSKEGSRQSGLMGQGQGYEVQQDLGHNSPMKCYRQEEWWGSGWKDLSEKDLGVLVTPG